MKALNPKQPTKCSDFYFKWYTLVLVLEAGWNHIANAASILANGEYFSNFLFWTADVAAL
jgi:hypothetical protein